MAEVVGNQATGLHSAPDISTQKYLLQRRNHEGHLIKVETFNEPVSQESVLTKFGPGYYILKATKPRFKTVWKQDLGEIERAKEFQTLKKRTKHLTYGVVGLGAIQAVGFGLTHLRFSGLEENFTRIKVLVQTHFNPEGFQCANCRSPLDFLLQDFCSQCGMPIDWPSRILLAQPKEPASECPNCRWPLLKHQIYCPHCGHHRSILIATESKSTWSLVPDARSEVTST